MRIRHERAGADRGPAARRSGDPDRRRGHLLLIRRTKPGEPVYWTTPGGGVEEADASIEAALHRELVEELGATAAVASQVFLFSHATKRGVAVHHFFAARLTTLHESARTGAEYSDPARGGYELDRIALRMDDLAAVDLKPPPLTEFLLANRTALLAEAASAM